MILPVVIVHYFYLSVCYFGCLCFIVYSIILCHTLPKHDYLISLWFGGFWASVRVFSEFC